MSKIKHLLKNYSTFISIPWRRDAAAPQRVIFCIYDETDELKLRTRIDEFEIATRESGHKWLLFDLTSTFPEWLTKQKYAKRYYENPDLLNNLMHKYHSNIIDQLQSIIDEKQIDDNYVIALQGVGTLFGLLKVKDIVESLAPLVKGRLLVFFPGSYDNNNFRLLDGYDGWNYQAVPITADKEF